MSATGSLVLVVGPSGVGKDTLLSGARRALADRGDIVFQPREVARQAGGENPLEQEIDTGRFEARRTAGAYALSWEAHGLGYGVGREIERDLSAGRTVVVNASRAVIDEARRRFARVAVVSIRAPRAALAERLARRGRETSQEIAARLARSESVRVAGPGVIEIDNAGSIEDGVAALVRAIETTAAYEGISTAPARTRGGDGSRGPG